MRMITAIPALAAALVLASPVVAADRPARLDNAAEMAGIELDKRLTGHTVFGGGYAAFDAGGSPGENSYWVFAQGIGRFAFGRWYADVFIDFGGFQFDFRALYTVDCVEVDRNTKEAWIDGTIIESNDPDNLGGRAFLYIKDGGGIDGADFHAITPLAEGVNCRQRPAPDFMEQAQSGNYYIER